VRNLRHTHHPSPRRKPGPIKFYPASSASRVALIQGGPAKAAEAFTHLETDLLTLALQAKRSGEREGARRKAAGRVRGNGRRRLASPIFCCSILIERSRAHSPASPSPSHCVAMGPSLSPLKRGEGKAAAPGQCVNPIAAFAGMTGDGRARKLHGSSSSVTHLLAKAGTR
jgi:hypothetical protein